MITVAPQTANRLTSSAVMNTMRVNDAAAAATPWSGSTNALRVVAMAVAALPLAPVGAAMWVAYRIQRHAEVQNT